jgi:hypothetical protein
LTLLEFGPAAVKRILDQEFGAAAPSLRWIKSLRASLRREPSDPWEFQEAEPEEAAAVLPVIGIVIEQTAGKVMSFTKGEAAAIWRIRAAAPDIDLWDAYRLARQFLAAPGDTDPLLWYLTFAPWRDNGTRITNAYRHRWIDRLAYRYETPGEALAAAERADEQKGRN